MRFTITSQSADIPFELDIRGYHIAVSDMATGSISVSDNDGRLAVCFTQPQAVAVEPVAVEDVEMQAILPEVETKVEVEQSEVIEPVVTAVEPSIEDAEQLFQHLVGLRKKIASELKLPPYIIFHDKTLHDMCRILPTDLDMLSTVPGVGQTKLEKYGLWFIQVIQDYVSHVKEVA